MRKYLLSPRRYVSQILSDRRGNFGLLTAILLPVLLGSVGLAIDFTAAYLDRTRLQGAVDAAVLAVARSNDTITDAEASQIAQDMLRLNGVKDPTNFTIERGKTDVTLVGAMSYATAFMKIFGITSVPISVAASATIVEAKYEIAMVLDTTGSMSKNNKLVAMKAAATKLVDKLGKRVIHEENLKFALVPFADFVNVGPDFGPVIDNGVVTRQPANWLDYDGNSPIDQSDFEIGVSRFPFFKQLGETWGGCVEARITYRGIDLATTDTAPDQRKPETLFVPAFASDEPAGSGYVNSYLSDGSAAIGASSWNERRNRYGANYKLKPVGLEKWALSQKTWASVSTDKSLPKNVVGFPYPKGPNFVCQTAPITPLTSNYAKIKVSINAFEAAGGTNIAEGVAWGWRVLSSGVPFTEGRNETEPEVTKVLILLTDGSNKLTHVSNRLGSLYGADGYVADGRLGASSDKQPATTAKLNERTLSVCQNAKDQGIQIYTILLEEDESTTKSMLTECASKISNFVAISEPSKLDDAFEYIRSNIFSVRLTH